MREIKLNKFNAKTVEDATQSFINFSREIEQTEFLIVFLYIGSIYINNDLEKAKELLIDLYEDKDNEVSATMVEYFRTEKADLLFDPLFYERHFSQMSFTRSIDNFVTYFKEILAEVVNKKPQILKSKDQERIDFILEYESMDDLLKAISEKKIEELFYKGISDIEKYFKDRLGIELFKDEETKNAINRLIKLRNLIVHNRGKFSKEFLHEFPDTNIANGLYCTLKYEEISEVNFVLHNYLVDLDIEITAKFNLDLIKTV